MLQMIGQKNSKNSIYEAKIQEIINRAKEQIPHIVNNV